MAGTIPLSLTQQFDEFGKPLSGGLLYIIQAGTVNTPQQPYQDAGLSIVQPNPIPLDAAGRVPQFFLADGQIKVRLDDKTGVTQLARDNILVIGPSAGGGGGGGSVDPTTVLQTGMLAVFYGTGQVPGFARANGRSIGNASSGATEATGNTVLALFQYLYNADPNLPLRNSSGSVIPRTGGDATASGAWANARQIDMPDWRGRTIAGLDDMGNAAAGRLTASYFGASGIVLGAAGGLENNTLTGAQNGPHQHDVFLKELPHGHPGSTGDVQGNTGSPIVSAAQPGRNDTAITHGQALTIAPNTTGITIGSVSGTANDNKTAASPAATPHNNVQPTMLCTIHLKL